MRVTGLPNTVTGIWSLWDVGLSAETFSHKRFLPIFVTDEGRSFVPTARRIWDLLLTEHIDLLPRNTSCDAIRWFEDSLDAATRQGEPLFSELLETYRMRVQEERERARYAFESRYQAIGRIGLPEVRDYRRRRLEQEHQARMASLDATEASVPDLNAVMMLRIGVAADPGAEQEGKGP